jgi:hypothetical protein
MEILSKASAASLIHPASALDLESIVASVSEPTAAAASSLAAYLVPPTSDDGGCGLPGKLRPEPYPLLDELCAARAALVGPSGAAAWRLAELQRLAQLRAVCAAVAAASGADWCGVYQVAAPTPGAAAWGGSATAPSLQKLAYVGAPSRALFPLTPEFAAGSNNATVGLSGDTVVIHDTEALPKDAPYYVCDGKVRSEVCTPIWGAEGVLLGIMDCEAFAPRAFAAPERLSAILSACAQLGAAALLQQN